MSIWNVTSQPIASRLRDKSELHLIQENKSMIYHESSKTTALIMDVWIVEPVKGFEETKEEDRYVRYTTHSEIREDYAVDLDDEGWLWYDELQQEER